MLPTEWIFKETCCQSPKCKPLKENILLASVNIILGADSGAKPVGGLAAPGFAGSKDAQEWG